MYLYQRKRSVSWRKVQCFLFYCVPRCSRCPMACDTMSKWVKLSSGIIIPLIFCKYSQVLSSWYICQCITRFPISSFDLNINVNVRSPLGGTEMYPYVGLHLQASGIFDGLFLGLLWEDAKNTSLMQLSPVASSACSPAVSQPIRISC